MSAFPHRSVKTYHGNNNSRPPGFPQNVCVPIFLFLFPPCMLKTNGKLSELTLTRNSSRKCVSRAMLSPPFCGILSKPLTSLESLIQPMSKQLEGILKFLGTDMLCFTSEECNRALSSSHDSPLHGAALTQIPTQLQFFSLTFHIFLWEPRRFCGLCPISSTLLLSLSSPLSHSATKMTWRERQRAQNWLLSALPVIWK